MDTSNVRGSLNETGTRHLIQPAIPSGLLLQEKPHKRYNLWFMLQ